MKKKLIAATAVAGVTLALGTAGIASAHDNKMGRGDKAVSVLKGLVEKGTLTQAQVDAITKAMTEARDADRAAHDAMHAERTKVITDTLGIDEATLKSRIQAGESLATIAGAKKDALINALVAYETKKIDEAVASGKLTAAQATEIKADLKNRVTAHVESTRGMGKAFGKEFGKEKGMGKGPKDFMGHKGKGHGRGGH